MAASMNTQSHQSHDNMMAYTSFTITQPFLGAPLQFTPALGSKELESLIDAYVVGSAPKQDKLSEVTIDFYKYATVDISTGALVRRYDVLPSPWASSPSAGFSPPMFTPSPSSSGYNSSFVGQTPPTKSTASRARGSRVAKKPTKKEAKSAAERLPGFSIMTKDGVDVTTSAGRGTKTKEQREHAHLMRIMKACEACKKKKVRCDPSHRRADTEMSRTSTKTSSPSKSPPTSTPSLSQQTSFTSQDSVSSFGGPNAINDFVLFPDTPSLEWNPADMSDPFPESQASELIDFDFDINAIGSLNKFPDHFFDFPAYGAEPKLQSAQPFEYSPFVSDQYDFDQFDSQSFMLVSHSTSAHTSSSGGSGSASISPLELQGSLPVCHSISSHTSTAGSPAESQGTLSLFNTPSSGSPQDWSPDGHTASLAEPGVFAHGFRPNISVDTSQNAQGAVSQEIPAVVHWSLSDPSCDVAVDHISHADPGDQGQRPPRHQRLDREKIRIATREPFEDSDAVAVMNYTEGSQTVVESLRSGSNQRFASQLSTQSQLLSSECRYQSILAKSSEDRFSLHQDRQSIEESVSQKDRPEQQPEEDNNGQHELARNVQLRISSNDHHQTRIQEAKTHFYLPAPFDMDKIVRQTISSQTVGFNGQQLSELGITATEIRSPTKMSSPRSIAACHSVASGSSIRRESSRSDKNPQKPHTSESRPESPQSVLCTTVPSLQTTVSPLQTLCKPSVFDIFQSSSAPLSSSPSPPRPITLSSDAYSTVANATTNPAIVTMTTLDDKQNRSLVMVAILASLTITALTYLESHATDSGTLLLCAISVAMARMANSVLLSCMDSASGLISTLSSMMVLMLGSDKLSPKGRKAAKRIVWNGFGRDNGRRSRMDICMSLRIR